MEFEVIFIAGPQGSGKGTQGKKLAEKLGFLFWGMGDVLREIQAQDIEFAQKLALLNHGTLLSDDMIVDILKQRVPLIPLEKGIIFDGVPRRVGQAEFLIPYLREHGREHMATIFLDLPREESIKRLSLRAQHEQRIDDTPEAIETRLQYYNETITPVFDYLKKETTFITIDGRPSADEIAANINEALGIAP
jgi:adenylate kinase